MRVLPYYFFLLSMLSTPAFATVIEMDASGNAIVHDAVDYLAGSRDSTKQVQTHTGRYSQLVRRAAEDYGLPESLLHAIIAVESNYNASAESKAGALGLMQLMPGTAKRFGVSDRRDASQNIHGGAAYLKWLLDRYGGDTTKALAAYNAGEGAVDKYGGIPPYKETIEYVAKVSDRLN